MIAIQIITNATDYTLSVSEYREQMCVCGTRLENSLQCVARCRIFRANEFNKAQCQNSTRCVCSETVFIRPHSTLFIVVVVGTFSVFHSMKFQWHFCHSFDKILKLRAYG